VWYLSAAQVGTYDMTIPRHLLTVWNPSYANDALDEHVRILLHWAERYRRGEGDFEDIYVWWAKLRSTNRENTKLPHHDDVLAIQKQLDDNIETHLYLTDYRSLFVANIEDITADDLLEDDELEHMPDYYRGRRADFWFRIIDIRRLVAEDTVAVIEELKRLSNTRYHNRPVSLYGGMIELPLIVTRDDNRSWFPETPSLTDGLLWVQHDSDLRGETDRMARELRDNLFGHVVWSALDVTTRSFLASAEAVYRSRRDDPNFDFSGPAVGYAKAVEAELNVLLFGTIRDIASSIPSTKRTGYVDGQPIDLCDAVPHQPLGSLLHLVERDNAMQHALKVAFQNDWRFLLGELPSHLTPIVSVRNRAAHSGRPSADDVAAMRQNVLGIGSEGLITRIARITLRVAG
jgi:hypothetical protein